MTKWAEKKTLIQDWVMLTNHQLPDQEDQSEKQRQLSHDLLREGKLVLKMNLLRYLVAENSKLL